MEKKEKKSTTWQIREEFVNEDTINEDTKPQRN